MPCKTGTREVIDQGRQRAIEERELDLYDPERKLWRATVHAVHRSSGGFDALSEPAKLYFAVGLLIGEVYNGGFEQYVLSNSAFYYDYTLMGLREMGASHSLALLSTAIRLYFEDGSFPRDTGDRRARLRAMQEERGANYPQGIEDCDQAFWKDPDKLDDLVRTFLLKHGLLARPS